MIRRILVPLDGSPGAEEALGHVALLARAFGARAHLLRVLSRPQSAAGEDPADPLAWRLARARASSYLGRVARELGEQSVEVSTEVQEGLPGEVIVELLRRNRHHLVVLTSHGAGRRSAMRIGATALSVLLNAATSVLLVPVGRGGVALGSLRYREVLAPVDGSPRGDWALGVAAMVARAAGGRLHILHVLGPPELLSRLPESGDCRELSRRVMAVNRREAKRYLKEMRSRLATHALEVDTSVEACQDGVSRCLERLARERGSDLVVLSAHGHRATPEWPYGGTAGRLLLSGNLPVLVLQDLTGPGGDPGEGAPEASEHFRDA